MYPTGRIGVQAHPTPLPWTTAESEACGPGDPRGHSEHFRWAGVGRPSNVIHESAAVYIYIYIYIYKIRFMKPPTLVSTLPTMGRLTPLQYTHRLCA